MAGDGRKSNIKNLWCLPTVRCPQADCDLSTVARRAKAEAPSFGAKPGLPFVVPMSFIGTKEGADLW